MLVLRMNQISADHLQIPNVWNKMTCAVAAVLRASPEGF